MSSAISLGGPMDETFGPDSRRMLARSLTSARREYAEQPEAAMVTALRCHEVARSIGELDVAARALALQGFISLHRGDLHSAVALTVAASDHAEPGSDLEAQAEVAALKAMLSFFTGSYVDAVGQANAALKLADRHDDRDLRLFVRRTTCPVYGNLGADDLGAHLELTLALADGDPREQALSQNDIATWRVEQGELESARHALTAGFALLEQRPDAHFARAVLHITSAELRLAADDPRGALIDSQRGLELLAGESSANPYLLGAAIQTQVQGLLALGDLDQARQLGQGTLIRLGDHIPHTRSLILAKLADALRHAGRLEEAFDTLAQASELERDAFRELVELQSGLEHARLETLEARRRSDSLMAKNRELAEAHAELERRATELESLQAQLRDQADRDWLTGLHNRRFLARQLDELLRDEATGPVSIAILDIDNFKAINDRFGHALGDRVLVEVARLLKGLQGPDDIVVRSGGEEFIAVMPETDQPAAVVRCEQVRGRIVQHAWSAIDPDLSVSVSIGVGSTTESTRLRLILEEADGHLYAAKRSGRNRVIAGGLG